MESEEKFINILREDLLHLRHQETQRMWSANVFVAIIVGASAYLGKEGLTGLPLAIPVVFLIISLLCLLITLKVNYVFTKTKDAIIKIFDDGKISLGEQQDWRKYVLLLESTGIWKMKFLRVRCLYIALYAIAIVASLSLIIVVIIN